MAKTKVHKKNNMFEKDQPEKTVLWHIAFWGLAILLFFPPFFRGLFFATEQRKALLFGLLIFGLVCLWKWLRKDYIVLSHPMDWFMLALPVVYVISSINAVNIGLAVDEIVKAALYFTVYWVVVQLVRKKKDAETLIYVIYVSAVLVALAGLMTATGLINIKDGFNNGRLASYFQYANALSSFMAAVFAMGTYLWWKFSHQNNDEQNFKNKINKYISFLAAMGNCLLVAVLIGTKSNGGFIVFGLAIFLMFVLAPGINRFLVLFHLAIVTIPAAGTIYFFLANVKGKHTAQAWLWVLGGLLITAGLQWLYLKFSKKLFQRENNTNRLLIIGLILFLVAGLVVSFTCSDEIKVLTGKFKAYSLMHRVYFVEDAFGMVRERPLFGWGGGGWQEAYQYFQSYSYVSRQVHSHYIQVAVETGIAGILVLAGLWSSFLASLYRAYRKKDSLFTTFIGVSVLIFGVHAVVDFDLSLSALSLVLYTSMAIIRNIDSGSFEQELPSTGKR
ncbi:MAG: O-antigen ligase family protein, partial [Desulfocucumaceae bacterium]